jgi:hypothetical protein
MITEKEIDNCILEVEKNPEQFHLEFSNEQSDLINYLNIETIPSLIDIEKEILLFCLSIIYHTCKDKFDTANFDIEDFTAAEEENWAKRDKDIRLEDSLDTFFNNYTQEDLLAFVEDMLIDDEDQDLTRAGKEIIFISAKSYIDTICVD